MTHYVHQVSGRIRVRHPVFRRRPDLLETIARDIRAVTGVRRVRSSHRACSIVIEYDTSVLKSPAILERLAGFGVCTEQDGAKAAARADNGNAPRPNPWLGTAGGAHAARLAVRTVVQTLVQSLAHAAVKKLAIRLVA